MMNHRITTRLSPVILLLLALATAGCSSWVQRIVTYSIENFGEPIQPADTMIVSPILPYTGLAVLWGGHATVMIQIEDKVFMTDPAFTKTVGMLLHRLVEPGIDPAVLTKVDYTLISHLHFDHFSFGSLAMLPKTGKLLIPPGGAAYTPEFGFVETIELQTWERMEENGVRITAVPVQHFSGRYGVDIPWHPELGYTGWVIEYRGKTVFVAGDTGYHPEYFKEIGRRFSIDVAIIPIGPAGMGSANSLGGRIHVSPRGAVQIFEDVGAKIMIPMHHRTLSYGSTADPMIPQNLLQAVIDEKGYHNRIHILAIGEQRVLIAEPAARTSGSSQ